MDAVFHIFKVLVPVCILVTVVLFIVCKWVRGTRWPEAVKVLVMGLVLNALVFGTILASLPLVSDYFHELTVKKESE